MDCKKTGCRKEIHYETESITNNEIAKYLENSSKFSSV